MVTAATCKGAVGAVSHPHALIPEILPGWDRKTSACRFVLLLIAVRAAHRQCGCMIAGRLGTETAVETPPASCQFTKRFMRTFITMPRAMNVNKTDDPP